MSKLERQKKSRFREAPPPIDDVRDVLSAPEHAPAAPIEEDVKEKKDGRTRRKKMNQRTEKFGTKVSLEFKQLLDELAEEANMLYVEVLEESLKDFQRKLKRRKQRGSQLDN